jgi:hypothetical protein
MAKQTFTTGQVLTAAQMTSLQQTAMGGGSATAKTASYVLTAADAGTTVIMNSGTATTITVNTALFAAGDTVFIVNQGAGVCTITAGTATVSTAGSLAMGQNETGQLYFLSSSAAIFTEYTQAAAGGGKVLQVVNAQTTTTANSSSTTFADTGLTATITPSSATSKILVFAHQASLGKTTGNAQTGVQLKLLRNSTELIRFEDIAGYTGAVSQNYVGSASTTYLDSPATTSATTYKTTFANTAGAGVATVQATYGGGLYGTSTITLMEIGA